MKKLIYCLSLLLFFAACRKDSESLSIVETNTNPPIIEVNGTIIGTVVDENERPIEAATVTAYNGVQTETDDDGVFVLRNIRLNQNGTYVKVEKTGFFHNSTLFYPGNNSSTQLDFMMIANTPTGSFSSTDGGTVSLGSGARLSIPANGVIDANGTAYTGNVNVAMTWLDPTGDQLERQMPGGLIGEDETGIVVSLTTAGMIGVELTDDRGNPLNLGNGAMADLSFPIPASLLNNAPAEIPLWHFDETDGIWKEDGKAIKQGNTYVGQVSHFSFWNCDAPFPLITLKGTVVNTDGDPLVNIDVRIIRETTGFRSMGYGRTDTSGVFCGKVPKDEVLRIEIYSICGSTLYSEQVGPFSTDTDLGTITVNNVTNNLYTFTGIAQDCNNNPLTNGLLKLTSSTGQRFAVLVEDGTIDYSVYICDPQDITYRITDLDDLEESDPQTISIAGSTTVDLGTVVACGNPLTEFLSITLDGVSKNYTFTLESYLFNDSLGGGSISLTLFDTISGGNLVGFSLIVEGIVPGTYDNTENSIRSIQDPDLGPNGIISPANFNVGFDQVILTEVGQVGGLIKGSFQSNNFEYFDIDDQRINTGTINGTFSMPRVR